MATPVFLEPGSDATFDLTLWAVDAPVATGTAASDSAQFQDGTRSIKVVAAAANDEATFRANGTLADAGSAVSFWIRFASVAPSVATGFFSAVGSTTTLRCGLDTTGKLRIDGRNATSKLGSTVLSANTWYRITLTWVLTSTSVWSFKCYLNGSLEVSTSNADGTLAAVGVSAALFGIGTFGGTSSPWTGTSILTLWIDSVYIDNRTDQSDPGEVHVTAKRPFANGTTNGFTTQIGAGGSGYGSGHAPQVNERPLNQVNGWSMVGAGSAVTEEYTIEGLAVGDVDLTGATVLGVMGWIEAGAAISETGKIVVDGTQTNIALTSTIGPFTQISATPTVYPAAGAAIGIVTATTVTTVSLYECGVIVAYLPPAAARVPYQPWYGLAPTLAQ